MEQLPHVSEEAAATSKSMGESGPQIEQGTPIQDVVKEKHGQEGFEKLPKVMRDSISQQKRSFHSVVQRRAGPEEDFIEQLSREEPPPPGMNIQQASQSSNPPPMQIPSREQQDYPGQYHEINEEEARKIALGELPEPLEVRKLAQVLAQRKQGLKFDLPSVPAGRQKHVKRRYDGVVEQVTNMIMRDGKKSVAQRV